MCDVSTPHHGFYDDDVSTLTTDIQTPTAGELFVQHARKHRRRRAVELGLTSAARRLATGWNAHARRVDFKLCDNWKVEQET